jgi:hypothetical protein
MSTLLWTGVTPIGGIRTRSVKTRQRWCPGIGPHFSQNRRQSSPVTKWRLIIFSTVRKTTSHALTCFQDFHYCSDAGAPRQPRFHLPRKKFSYRQACHEFFSRTEGAHLCQTVFKTSCKNATCGTASAHHNIPSLMELQNVRFKR